MDHDTIKERLLTDYEDACTWLAVCLGDHQKAMADVVAAEESVDEVEATLRAYLTGAE